jgi:hypothetical protein
LFKDSRFLINTVIIFSRLFNAGHLQEYVAGDICWKQTVDPFIQEEYSFVFIFFVFYSAREPVIQSGARVWILNPSGLPGK